jgi:hypothetical protein
MTTTVHNMHINSLYGDAAWKDHAVCVGCALFNTLQVYQEVRFQNTDLVIKIITVVFIYNQSRCHSEMPVSIMLICLRPGLFNDIAKGQSAIPSQL